jgi:anti-anti-sigma factor
MGAAMGTSGLHIDVTERPDRQVFAVIAGELDITTADELRAGLRDAAAGGGSLCIDLAGIDFVDSSGLGALVKLHNTAEEHGTELELRNVPSKVQRLLEITKLSDLFVIAAS